jgi:hypothetical protein
LDHLEELTPEQVRAGTRTVRSYEEWQNIFKKSEVGRSLGVSHLFVEDQSVWVYRFLYMNVHRKQFPTFFTSLAPLYNSAATHSTSLMREVQQKSLSPIRREAWIKVNVPRIQPRTAID